VVTDIGTPRPQAVAFLCYAAADHVTGEATNVSGGCEMH
jgi:hypothetical protein